MNKLQEAKKEYLSYTYDPGRTENYIQALEKSNTEMREELIIDYKMWSMIKGYSGRASRLKYLIENTGKEVDKAIK